MDNSLEAAIEAELERLARLENSLRELPEEVFGLSTWQVRQIFGQYVTVRRRLCGRFQTIAEAGSPALVDGYYTISGDPPQEGRCPPLHRERTYNVNGYIFIDCIDPCGNRKELGPLMAGFADKSASEIVEMYYEFFDCVEASSDFFKYVAFILSLFCDACELAAAINGIRRGDKGAVLNLFLALLPFAFTGELMTPLLRLFDDYLPSTGAFRRWYDDLIDAVRRGDSRDNIIANFADDFDDLPPSYVLDDIEAALPRTSSGELRVAFDRDNVVGAEYVTHEAFTDNPHINSDILWVQDNNPIEHMLIGHREDLVETLGWPEDQIATSLFQIFDEDNHLNARYVESIDVFDNNIFRRTEFVFDINGNRLHVSVSPYGEIINAFIPTPIGGN